MPLVGLPVVEQPKAQSRTAQIPQIARRRAALSGFSSLLVPVQSQAQKLRSKNLLPLHLKDPCGDISEDASANEHCDLRRETLCIAGVHACTLPAPLLEHQK